MLQSLFNTVETCNFIKKNTPTKVFFVNIVKILRTVILKISAMVASAKVVIVILSAM